MNFAANVQATANRIRTPPFTDRVSIRDLYDQYGIDFADAGSLASFKTRLTEAFRRREISLARLDVPDLLDQFTRTSSEMNLEGHRYHFVRHA